MAERHETGAEADDPSPHDVLFGRGAHQHPGNRNYLEMVRELEDDYANGSKFDKLLIVNNIISNLRAQDPPVRFLIKDGNTGHWIDMGNEELAKKVRRALNDRENNLNPEER